MASSRKIHTMATINTTQFRRAVQVALGQPVVSSCSSTTKSTMKTKKEGNISDSFVSLSNTKRPPLAERFLTLKKTLISGHEDAVIASWKQLLRELKFENKAVAREKSNIIPSIEFGALERDLTKFRDVIRKRGVAVIRGVIPEAEARAYKTEIEEYVRLNPSTPAFPKDDPQVYELYWSAPQLKARSHPNLLKAQTALMSIWSTSDPSSVISTTETLSYADRLRIRQPGDATFALGPHMDGGSVERWELNGYGLGGVYNTIFSGNAQSYDPWDASTRVDAVMDNYNGQGACSMFRMFQGWLSMSHTAPLQGTLMVNPLIRLSTAYVLLRPFFKSVKERGELGEEEYLNEENWVFAGQEMNSELQGAEPGFGQELNDALHPHLELEKTMVHVPEVKPGDYVVWHCDTIHAVDKVHTGKADSSVLYIPVCPVTEINARYAERQRAAFVAGTPGPDFPGGVGESKHQNRCGPDYLLNHAGVEGLRAAGFQQLVSADEDSVGARKAVTQANAILGFQHDGWN